MNTTHSLVYSTLGGRTKKQAAALCTFADPRRTVGGDEPPCRLRPGVGVLSGKRAMTEKSLFSAARYVSLGNRQGRGAQKKLGFSSRLLLNPLSIVRCFVGENKHRQKNMKRRGLADDTFHFAEPHNPHVQASEHAPLAPIPPFARALPTQPHKRRLSLSWPAAFLAKRER